MKKFLSVIFALVFLAACGREGGRVIPEGKLVKIYADMALADRWISMNPEAVPSLDTTLLYEAVFNKYGYTTEDYYASVNYYLKEPEEFSWIIEQARARLVKKSHEFEAQLQLEEHKGQKENSQIQKVDD